MKLAVRIALLIGLALLISLIAHEGAAILLPITRAGWLLLWLVPLHVVPVLLDSRGWQVLIHRRVKPAVLFWIATVREAVDRLLPVANIGGELVGVRLLALMGVDGVVAAASVTTELLLTLFSQYVFVLAGVTCLLSVTDTEAALIGVGRLLGVDAELALALSLAKRMREILFGTPALLSWYWIEGRKAASPATASNA